MRSSLFRSLVLVGAFLVVLGALAWPGSAAAWGGGSVVVRHQFGHFGHGLHRHTAVFPGTLFPHRFGHTPRVRLDHHLRPGHRFGRDCDFHSRRVVFPHRHRFGLRHRGGFHHGHSVPIFRR